MTRLHEPRWLLLIHQIPPHPAYFRARVGRRLQRLGAVAIKNAVYALPSGTTAREALQSLAREIASDGGEATLCEASLVDGLSDEQVEGLFRAAREVDYAELADEAREAARQKAIDVVAELVRLRKRLSEIIAIDFFAAPSRAAVESALTHLASRLPADDHPDVSGPKRDGRVHIADYQKKTWVTRKGIHVDRIASGWLVRRFIDPNARFRFVPPDGYRSKPNEVSFDMANADFTHVGDACSFETIVKRFELREPGLEALSEIIHELDIKDGKFACIDAPGVGAIFAGIAASQAEDERRIEVGSALLDALLTHYARRTGGGGSRRSRKKD